MKTKRLGRMFAIMLVMTLSLLMALPVYAASPKDQVYWNEIVGKLIDQGMSFTSSEDLAQRLSSLGGNSMSSDMGTKYPNVLIQAGGAEGGVYMNGSLQVLDDYVATSLHTKYREIPISGVNASDGTGLSATVYVYAEADAGSVGKINANVQTNIFEATANITPDTGTAMLILSGLQGPVNAFLGFAVIIITTGMFIFSALDICYISFPAFRGGIDKQVESGGAGAKTNKDGSTSSRWVTDDARLAVEEAAQANITPWKGYFKRRIMSYIFLSITLYILLTNNITALTTLVISGLQGLFTAIGLG